jgi:hypothetical protein
MAQKELIAAFSPDKKKARKSELFCGKKSWLAAHFATPAVRDRAPCASDSNSLLQNRSGTVG